MMSPADRKVAGLANYHTIMENVGRCHVWRPPGDVTDEDRGADLVRNKVYGPVG